MQNLTEYSIWSQILICKLLVLVISAEYADMNRGQLLAKIHELEEVSYVIVFTNIDWTSYTLI